MKNIAKAFDLVEAYLKGDKTVSSKTYGLALSVVAKYLNLTY